MDDKNSICCTYRNEKIYCFYIRWLCILDWYSNIGVCYVGLVLDVPHALANIDAICILIQFAPCRKDLTVLTVLIADGYPLSLRGLHSALQEYISDINIFDANCLDVAVNLLAERSPVDLAIFTIPMPGIPNIDALHDVMEHYPHTRFAVLSSSISRIHIVAALSAGVHGYLVNSQTEAEMIVAITDILAGHIYVPPVMSEVTRKRDWENPPAYGLLNRHHEIDQEIADLTPRQFEVMSLLAEGGSNKEIARDLHIAEATVKIHVAAIMRTLGARNRTEAAVLITSNHKY